MTPTKDNALLADTSVFKVWKEDARRDDWHMRFVGSDIRQMIGEIERLSARLASSPDASGVGEVLSKWQSRLADLGDMKARGDLTKDWGECSLINARNIVADLTAALSQPPANPLTWDGSTSVAGLDGGGVA